MADAFRVPPAGVLAIGAHPDDIELGCGGSLVRFQQAGSKIHVAVFSGCHDETPAEPSLRSREFRASMREIGVDKPLLFDFPNRQLPEHRFEIMAEMEKLQTDLAPDLVFVPFLEDPHQDHETVARAAIRTFRRRETVLQYEILRYGSHTFTPSLFIDVTGTLDRKIAALRRYESQFRRRPYFDEESFRSLARTRGAQSGYAYAEGFVVYKLFW
jgi:LmbE family N-acetylglucosaminyl deacetylase